MLKNIYSEATKLDTTLNIRLKKNCPDCKVNNSLDSQEHLLVCETLLSANSVVMEIPAYNDLFGNDLDNFINVVILGLRYACTGPFLLLLKVILLK